MFHILGSADNSELLSHVSSDDPEGMIDILMVCGNLLNDLITL